MALAFATLALAAKWLAPRIPFEYELGIAAPFVEALAQETGDSDPRVQLYLQGMPTL